jgi:hypothetical protein
LSGGDAAGSPGGARAWRQKQTVRSPNATRTRSWTGRSAVSS